MPKILRYIPALLLTVCVASQAGNISGKVTGGKGVSVGWVEAAPGKTSPPAAGKPQVMDQKSLLFQPHILVAPVGSTIEFLNSDKVAHNIFWPAINGNKKLGHNLGTWPTGEKRTFQPSRSPTSPMAVTQSRRGTKASRTSPSP
jgi:plastocyanin